MGYLQSARDPNPGVHSLSLLIGQGDAPLVLKRGWLVRLSTVCWTLDHLVERVQSAKQVEVEEAVISFISLTQKSLALCVHPGVGPISYLYTRSPVHAQG